MKQEQLEAVRAALAKAQALAREAAEQEKAQALLKKQVTQEFKHHVGQVTPLATPARVQHAGPAPEPVARQRMLDEKAALQATISDEFDVESLLETDEALSFRRPHVGVDVPRKLRRGQWALQAEIDLHGMTRDAAREALTTFLSEANKRGLRCVRVVHGKGIGSPGRVPVLKSKVRTWLVQSDFVMAFVQATGAQGGNGALLVLLA